MRKTILPFLASVLAVAVSLFWPTRAAHAAGGIRWGTSLSVAMAQAKKTDRLVMVDFYTEWCAFCKKLDAETYTDPAVMQGATELIPLKLDAEREGRDLAHKLRVAGYPAIYFINGSGEVEGVISGFETPDRFLAHMKQFTQRHRELPIMRNHLRANPNDLPAAAKLTEAYASLGKHKQASATLAQVARLDPASAKGFLNRSTMAVAHMWMVAAQPDQALPLIRQATKMARNSEERVIAHMNLAMCYGEMNNINAAEAELNTTLRLPNCPSDAKQAAQNMLARIQQFRSQGH